MRNKKPVYQHNVTKKYVQIFLCIDSLYDECFQFSLCCQSISCVKKVDAQNQIAFFLNGVSLSIHVVIEV